MLRRRSGLWNWSFEKCKHKEDPGIFIIDVAVVDGLEKMFAPSNIAN